MKDEKGFLHNSTLFNLCEVEMFAGEAEACETGYAITTMENHVQMLGYSRIIAGSECGIRYPHGNATECLHIPYGDICLLLEHSYYVRLIDTDYPNINKIFVKLITGVSVKFGTITRKTSQPFTVQEKEEAFLLARCCVEHISVAHVCDMTAHMQKVQADFRNGLNPEFGDTSIDIHERRYVFIKLYCRASLSSVIAKF